MKYKIILNYRFCCCSNKQKKKRTIEDKQSFLMIIDKILFIFCFVLFHQ
jgi:hypothetical protein